MAFILAIIGGFKLLQIGMDFLDNLFNISGEVLPYVSFIAIFIAIVLLVNLLGKILKKVLDLTLLGAVDNLAGAILAVIKWAFGLSVILWLTSTFGMELPEEWTAGSWLYPNILPFAPKAVSYITAVMPFAHDLFDMIKEMLQGDTSA